jgi:hypothetical protein
VATLAACSASVPPTQPGSTRPPGGSVTETPISAADWTSVTWRKLAPTDELASFGSVVRVSSGFIAIGQPKSTESGFRTPLWTSADGAAWQELPASVVGGDTIVTGVYEVSGTLVAMTLAGGAKPCEHTAGNCLHLQPPLRAWSSVDGTTWTFRSQPLTLRVATDTGELEDLPRAATTAALMLVGQGRQSFQLAASKDGETWSGVSTTGLPPDFAGDLAGAVGGGFVLTGASGADEAQKPVVAWSADGTDWEAAALPVPKRTVGSAGSYANARAGMIIDVSTDVTPSGPDWWSSTTGREWREVKNFAPLGTWNGEGEGSGMLPNGQLLSDGERMLAYDTLAGAKAWTSFDGVNWGELTILGDRPPTTGGFANAVLTVTAIGLFWRDDQSNVWFGQPNR